MHGTTLMIPYAFKINILKLREGIPLETCNRATNGIYKHLESSLEKIAGCQGFQITDDLMCLIHILAIQFLSINACSHVTKN